MLGLFSLDFSYLPAASTSAERFESFWHFLLVTSIATFVLVVGAAFIFVIKYRRKHEGEQTAYIPHNFLVEFFSLFATSVVVAIIFIWGWQDYKYMITPKLDELEINVIGQQWNWQIQYADGRNFTNEMYVPLGRPVKLILAAKDVLHSFYVPAFRIKQDAVPGQFTELRFTTTKTGTFDIFCAEYCGTSHSGMIGKIHVLPIDDYRAWQNGTYKAQALVSGPNGGKEAPPLSMAEKGAALYRTKVCNTCHTTDGARLVGPTFKGLWGSEHELMDGSKVIVDENYFRESLMDPMKKVVKGYPPAMPTYRGQLNDEEINQLIAYLKTLK
jgi:cytochrome c oxidase subunit II